MFHYFRLDDESIEILTNASAAEAEACSAALQAAKAAFESPMEGDNNNVDNIKDLDGDMVREDNDNTLLDSTEPDVKLHPRAVSFDIH